jgi:hypothetical protein
MKKNTGYLLTIAPLSAEVSVSDNGLWLFIDD